MLYYYPLITRISSTSLNFANSEQMLLFYILILVFISCMLLIVFHSLEEGRVWHVRDSLKRPLSIAAIRQLSEKFKLQILIV